jgi:proline iminopeptidase
MHPVESQADIAAALPPSLVRFERFADCGHGVAPDTAEWVVALLRDFILKRWINFLPELLNESPYPLGFDT